MANLIKLDISGDNPIPHAKRILDQYAEDEAIKSISLKINADFAESGTKHATINNTPDSGEEKTTKDREAKKDSKRERGDIRSDTSHHRVLFTLSELSNGDMVSGRKVKEAVEDVSERSIYPALTQLWERKLADRERVEDADNPHYKYQPTQYGHEKLEELGDPTEE